MAKLVQIKCRECGSWAKIKVRNGDKMKKICRRCSNPELFTIDPALI